MIRTHNCNDLRIRHDKANVSLIGWAQRIRDHGGKKFIDLRDGKGITQIVFDPKITKNFKDVEHFKREFLISISGNVRPRPEGTINDRYETGKIEVIVSNFEIINTCDTLPFDIDEEHFKEDLSEELRLEYRYLDLRRPKMQKIFFRKHKFLSSIRHFLDDIDFIEIETPILTKSTPEGARDVLVPSRKHFGKFYALPQSPQLFKQILMVSGFERYYQIARCFRDEDSRKDRQLEFSQLDIEMSFFEFNDFKKLVEDLLIKSFKIYNINLTRDNFQVLTYSKAIDKYASDKPDTRIIGLELRDISDIVKNCKFSVFKNVISGHGIVKGMKVENGQDKITRNDIDKLIEFSKENGSKGMAWMKVIENNDIESSITKFFTKQELEEISKIFKAKQGDLLFFIADKKENTNNILDLLRRHIASKYDLIDKNSNNLIWITDFPLFQLNSENKELTSEHSPFTMPNSDSIKFIEENINSKEDITKYKKELLSLKADCYDIVYNGVEIASGAKRIHIPLLQEKIFQIINLSKEEINEKFGWFLRAYDFGAPFHRGIAFGIDRIIMILENENSIREVMAFPKNKVGFCPLTNSPSRVDEIQLKEVHIKIREQNSNKN